MNVDEFYIDGFHSLSEGSLPPPPAGFESARGQNVTALPGTGTLSPALDPQGTFEAREKVLVRSGFIPSRYGAPGIPLRKFLIID